MLYDEVMLRVIASLAISHQESPRGRGREYRWTTLLTDDGANRSNQPDDGISPVYGIPTAFDRYQSRDLD